MVELQALLYRNGAVRRGLAPPQGGLSPLRNPLQYLVQPGAVWVGFEQERTEGRPVKVPKIVLCGVCTAHHIHSPKNVLVVQL